MSLPGRKPDMQNKLITNVVFTRNRPLQLDGYLRSLRKFFPADQVQVYIIYKVERFGEEYESVFSQYPDVEVIRESNFHCDMLEVLSRVDTEYILFGIDDVIFFDGVSLALIEKTFEKAGDDIFGFTMRFSPELVREGGDEVRDVSVGNDKVYKLHWPGGHTKHTRYPFELCSTVYRASLVRNVISHTMSGNSIARGLFSPGSGLMRAWSRIASPRSLLKKFGFFYSPNTLESWPCRWCRNHSGELPGFTYFQKICAVAIQVNMVNTSTRNEHYGTDEHTVEALNAKYREGYVLDIDFVAACKPPKAGGGPECFRLTRASR